MQVTLKSLSKYVPSLVVWEIATPMEQILVMEQYFQEASFVVMPLVDIYATIKLNKELAERWRPNVAAVQELRSDMELFFWGVNLSVTTFFGMYDDEEE